MKFLKIKKNENKKMKINIENLNKLINEYFCKRKGTEKDRLVVYFSDFEYTINNESEWFRYHISIPLTVYNSFNIEGFYREDKIIIMERFYTRSLSEEPCCELEPIYHLWKDLFYEKLINKRDNVKKIINQYEIQLNLEFQTIKVNDKEVHTFIKEFKIDNNFNKNFIDYLEILRSFYLDINNFLEKEDMNSINIFEEYNDISDEKYVVLGAQDNYIPGISKIIKIEDIK